MEEQDDALSQVAIRPIKLTELHLDARNPRLLDLHALSDTEPTEVELAQKILDEHDPRAIGRSLVAFGYFQTDPLIVFKREAGGYTVVEGNRRLVAVKLLTDDELRGQLELPNEWNELAAQFKERRPTDFDELPCQELADRRAAAPTIGYRHIVGIKKWGAYEKAAFVVELIRDPDHRDFTQVARLTGESVAKVKTYFRDFLVLDQAAKAGIDTGGARDEFGKFTRAMTEPKLRAYIQAIESQEIEEAADAAYGDDEATRNVISLMFGDADGAPPAFTDSRKVHDFAISLATPESREILLNTRDLPTAFQASGGPLERLLKNLGDALGAVQKAVQDYPAYKDEPEVSATLEAIKEALKQLEEATVDTQAFEAGQEAGDEGFDPGWDDEEDVEVAESDDETGAE
jgi:hypothetical protein